MKMTRTLMLLAGIALFASCKKDEDQKTTDVAISGKWNKVTEYRRITQSGVVTKDTINFAPGADNWTFDPAAGKIYQLKNAQPDTVFYKLIEENKKVLTAIDDEFIFQKDTLNILQLDNYHMKLEGNYRSPFQMNVIINFAR